MSRIAVCRDGRIIAESTGEREAQLLFREAYKEGDALLLESDEDYAVIRVDQCVAPARVFMPGRKLTYRLPLSGDNPAVYPPMAFRGDMHLITVGPDPYRGYRNLAENPADQRGNVTAWPHATANIETRDESVFCARNVIDGLHIATDHGYWPFQSWGVELEGEPALTVDFGREVEIDRVVIYLRADFPHDAWWSEGTLVFSDGTETGIRMEPKNGAQEFLPGKHRIRWIRLERLVKADDPSPFPALRQLEVYGCDL